MSAIIVSCFPGCGKTYLCEKVICTSKIIDLDAANYSIQKEWPRNYFNAIISLLDAYEIILISQHEEILELLNLNRFPFYIVAPNNSDMISDKKRHLIKQQWFGRFFLRDNSHIKNTTNIEQWFDLLLLNYDKWTSIEHLRKYQPDKIILLDETEYLADIITTIKNNTQEKK
jgi:hypothetical protein